MQNQRPELATNSRSSVGTSSPTVGCAARTLVSVLAYQGTFRAAARSAENPYSGISHSGNQRDTSSSHGSSFPSWDFRRSSRSLSRAFSPFAGTNG
jgi:hypothetical protein